MVRLTGEQIGDNLDLEVEARYPCSSGGYVSTVSVDRLLQALLRAVVEWVEREDGFRSDSNSIYLGIPKSKWQALKAELEEAPDDRG